MKKFTVDEARSMKGGRKLAVITSYDYSMAQIADKSGVDIVLVGDSASMVVMGNKDTIPITLDEMLLFSKAVSRGVENALLVADMPFMSYNVSLDKAVENACRLVKEGGVDAIKIEGGLSMQSTAKAIVQAGVPVMGHIGMMPQTASLHSGYKVQGKTVYSAKKIIEDAYALEEAGVFSIVLELMAEEVAKVVTEEIRVPTIGIGSGAYCDGQVLVLHDILGLYGKLSPKFVKRYVNLSETIQKVLETYREDVISGRFPQDKHTFHMDEKEFNVFMKELGRKVSPPR